MIRKLIKVIPINVGIISSSRWNKYEAIVGLLLRCHGRSELLRARGNPPVDGPQSFGENLHALETALDGGHPLSDVEKRVWLLVGDDLLKLFIQGDPLLRIEFTPVLFQDFVHPSILITDRV